MTKREALIFLRSCKRVKAHVLRNVSESDLWLEFWVHKYDSKDCI